MRMWWSVAMRKEGREGVAFKETEHAEEREWGQTRMREIISGVMA